MEEIPNNLKGEGDEENRSLHIITLKKWQTYTIGTLIDNIQEFDILSTESLLVRILKGTDTRIVEMKGYFGV